MWAESREDKAIVDLVTDMGIPEQINITSTGTQTEAPLDMIMAGPQTLGTLTEQQQDLAPDAPTIMPIDHNDAIDKTFFY